MLLALSTSGTSPNILAGLRAARERERERGIVTTGMTGSKGQAMGAQCDHLLVVPSDETPLVQQIHLAVAHGICDSLEQTFLGKDYMSNDVTIPNVPVALFSLTLTPTS